MDKRDIEVYVENIINERLNNIKIGLDKEKNVLDLFYLKTANRLLHAYYLYIEQDDFFEDFMLSLRDYLIVFDTSIEILNIIIPENNNFAIRKNNETNKYFSTFQLPKYVEPVFIEKAFMREVSVKNELNKNNVLYTDPLINKITGFTSFKSLAQKLAVYGALKTPEGYTTLVSLPTGGGKSLITQVISYQKRGLTVIVVPTVSLAIDQERSSKKIIKSEEADNEIFSYSSGTNLLPIIEAIEKQTAKMLFISPEALINNQAFVDAISDANNKRYLKNIIIDEAHIVLDWGALFRVDYQCLEVWRKKQLLSNPSIRTILLSATFEEKSIYLLKSFFSTNKNWIEVRCDGLRHEPRYIVVKSRLYTEKMDRILELVRKLPHPMIIYVATPSEAKELKERLNDNGIKNIETYTGLTKKHERKRLIDDWIKDKFEIMVATSAFGVGVDKGDVRSVIHTYIPENANSYYQELGRGGRDGLPCLSVMCLGPNDSEAGRKRISKRVLTKEKIIGRWDSMYNNKNSTRQGKEIYIDTSIKPNYAVEPYDDSPTSDADMNWNIYVLLLLRRYNFIKIVDIIKYNKRCTFLIEITEDRLRKIDVNLITLINIIREKEWSYYNSSYKLLKMSIEKCDDECLSEMFYETYSKVSEFCAGCNKHTKPIEGDIGEFPLKVPIPILGKPLSEEQKSLFGDSGEIIVFADFLKKDYLYKGIIKKGVSTMVLPNNKKNEVWDKILEQEIADNILITGCDDIVKLINADGFYYIEGIVAVFYDGKAEDILKTFTVISRYLRKKSFLRIIHIVEENVYFSSLEKTMTELIEGPIVTIEALLV